MPKVRVRTRHHRRRMHRDYGINRYSIEERMRHIYDDCRNVEELRERFRAFVDNDAIWEAVDAIRETSLAEATALQHLEDTVKRAFPAQKPRRKKAA